MSPAGHWPQLQAAIEAGADAVYFGLKHFSARAKVGFTLAELPAVMAALHRRAVRGYVTFNTLVFEHELAEAARVAAAIAEAGADAFIVQDVGVARLLRAIVPEAEVHGSTQMSITSAEGIALAQQFGVSRVVLARELSLADVRTIRAETTCELEIFAHGALCVSYSGQCFSSEAWGGRSANRGQCAQACRLPYDLIVDGARRPLGDARYLLSPGDLYTLHHIPEIVQIGVSALKIEGRYKDASYVALTTRAYRQAVDAAWDGAPVAISRVEEIHLEQAYSRGLGPHFVTGTNHQTVVSGRSPRHRGVLMGRVTRVLPDTIMLLPAQETAVAPLKAGDGVVFDAADWRSPEEQEEGGRVNKVVPLPGGQIELRFWHGTIDSGRIRPGDLVWRTYDADLERAARPYTQAGSPAQRQRLNLKVTAYEGEPLRVEWALAERPDLQVTVRSDEPLGRAQQRAISVDYLREQLGRLGTTPYELAEVGLDLRGHPFAPGSLLNSLRRAAVAQLAELQSRPRPVALRDPLATLASARALIAPTPSAPEPCEPQLHLLVRTPEQLDAALALRPASLTLDYLDLYGLGPAVERVRAAGVEARVASPRILKPAEQRIVQFLRRLGCAVLVRSAGLLQALCQQGERPDLVGDFSLNAANALTADTFLQLGLTRITPTHDLNAAQVTGLAQAIGGERLEVVAYQHLPVFHTEHCVFCRFLSTGTSYKDCGLPCEQHRVALRDTSGRAHPVMADVGCRNTVFGAEAQEASRHLDAWRDAGIRHIRLEFVHETASDVASIGQAFQAYLLGTLTAPELTRRLQRLAPQGTTEGSLFVPAGYETIPLMQ